MSSLYQPEGNSDDEFMPASFVEENAGKERFTGFDELILMILRISLRILLSVRSCSKNLWTRP